jgi:hypothetical protein
MSQNDSAVVTAAVGYVYVAAPGTPRPSPAQLAEIDPEAFGSSSSKLAASAVPTGGTFALTVGEGTVAPKQAVETIPAKAPAQEASTLEATGVEPPAATPDPKAAKSSKTSKAVAADEPVASDAPSGTTLDLPFDSGAAEVQTALENIEGVGSGNVKVTGGGFTADGFTVAFVGKLGGENVEVTVNSKLEPVTVTVDSTVATAPNGWSTVGHTARDDLPEFGYDGGDTEVRGTWQNENLREVVTQPISDFLTIFLQQFDMQSFELYYGQDASKQAGVFGVKGGTPTPVERALFIIVVDGDTKIGFYAPKASIKRDDSISLATDEFASLPIRATFLKYGSSNIFEWINQDLFTP